MAKTLFLFEDAVDFPKSKYMSYSEYVVCIRKQYKLNFLEIPIIWIEYFHHLKNHILPLIILVSFGIMVLYNGLTSTCSVSILFEDYLN